ncbi:unnamed protein product [Brassica oleracea var. botrytis]|uniref:jacalin-related lectin 24 n=1 Tax=Brassica napus TaxID=3708 RepID=UPI002078CB96|nr:jacalin-related lectin 24 [Brassica napus]
MIRAGSVGRKRTCEPEDWDEKGRTMISHIYVSFDSIIRSIQFGYTEINEGLTLSKQYGPSEGYSFRVVSFVSYVTGLSGSLGYHGGIANLIFHTNRGKHGPFANDDNAPPPKIEIDPSIRDRREFGGFFGSYTFGGITSIGIYVNPIPSSHGVTKREKFVGTRF